MFCKFKIFLAGFLLISFFWGCAHPVSKEVRAKLDPDFTFESLIENPGTFLGKRVLFGGVIVVTRNLKEGTEIELVHKNLDFAGNPEPGNYSGGRFLFFNKGYLEPEIYSPGKNLIGVGKVIGKKLGKIGDYPYQFPVIEVEELHLLKDMEQYPYFHPPYWDPWYRPNLYSPYGFYYR